MRRATVRNKCIYLFLSPKIFLTKSGDHEHNRSDGDKRYQHGCRHEGNNHHRHRYCCYHYWDYHWYYHDWDYHWDYHYDYHYIFVNYHHELDNDQEDVEEPGEYFEEEYPTRRKVRRRRGN